MEYGSGFLVFDNGVWSGYYFWYAYSEKGVTSSAPENIESVCSSQKFVVFSFVSRKQIDLSSLLQISTNTNRV